MKRLIALCLGISSMLVAAEVEVTAEKFFADEKKKISIFEGHVVVIKEGDKLTAKKVTIEFDDKKQPIRYIATGDAKGNLTMNQKKYYGEAEKMTYEPSKSLYTLEKKHFCMKLKPIKKCMVILFA